MFTRWNNKNKIWKTLHHWMLGIKYFVRGFWNQRVKPTPYGLRPRRPLVPPWHKSTISLHILCNISTSLVKLKWNHDATLRGATEDVSQLRYYFLSETTYKLCSRLAPELRSLWFGFCIFHQQTASFQSAKQNRVDPRNCDKMALCHKTPPILLRGRDMSV